MENITIDYSRHYEKWHQNSPEHISKMILLYEKTVLPYFPADKATRILDIGCGMGFLLLALQKHGYTNISGIDVDPRQVECSKQNGLRVSLVTDTMAFLDNHSGQYDLISAFDVLEHVPPSEQISFVNAVLNALPAGGVFILSVPNATSALASRNRYIDYTHHVLFTEVSLDFVLYNAGFRNIAIFPLDYVTFSFSVKSILHRLLLGFFRLSRRLEMIAELGTTWGRKVPLTFNLLGIAKKLPA